MDPISGERRVNRRYELQLPVRYRVSLRKGQMISGAALTRDVSTGGIAFTADEVLPVGRPAELWIEWPAQIDQQGALELHIVGAIVRSQRGLACVRIRRHQFVTVPERGNPETGARARARSMSGQVPDFEPEEEE
jgi:hypothetical protein